MKISSLQKGLVGHWTMSQDSLKGSLLADKTPYENDGTIYGATFATDRHGQPNKAMSFDGVNNYINCGNGVSLNIAVEQGLTIEVWIKTSSTTDGAIVSKFPGSGDSPGYYTVIYGNGVLSGWIGDNSGTPTPNWSFGGITVNDNKWHHIVWVRSRNTNKLLGYIDGVLAGVANDTTVSGLENKGNLLIGDRSMNMHRYFNGLIDDVRIYNRALSQEEITLLYNSYNPKIIL